MKKKEVKQMNKYIISEYIDTDAMNILEIIDDFCTYLKTMDGSQLSKKDRDLIISLCEQYPILRILCSAMQHIGYESF